ncbi:hypothetical protein [Thermoanaerobacterium sp. RBIITD]|uniref:hypothetical protein n=1 Tax=Thermoanaerobacterium sp. RBIITD TaxID=1550240 RepID=UPI000BB95367|nr:hypothetical protein [Thermoanaerobacterium sp. RBIITD]SNX55023.1 hypothetical protein SAMN05660242_2806 [Thermoanaerobacterium sp. RBIITD]
MMTYLEKQEDNLIVRRYYYTNERRDTVIKTLFAKEYFEKIYVDNKFVSFDNCVGRDEIECDLENLLFNDALVFKII